MDARKITIVETRTQKKSVIMSSAATLSQLKSDLDEAGIDYSDMTFYEGVSKTELKSDDSALPHDVPYTNRTTGETTITNELVFMLTNANKKIKSGASQRRQEVYAEIKNLGLQAGIKETFGKNYTQVSTEDLEHYIESLVPQAPTANISDFEPTVNVNAVDVQARKAIELLVNALYDRTEVLTAPAANFILTKIGAEQVTYKALKSSYSDEDIDAMLSEIQ
jgi:hypothetical protein